MSARPLYVSVINFSVDPMICNFDVERQIMCEAAKKPDPRVERPKKSSAAGCDSGQTPATSTTPTDEPKATPGFALRAHLLMNV